MKAFFRLVVGLIVLTLLGGVTAPAQAGDGNFLMNRKFHGMLVLGLGGFMIKEAVDAKREANDAYDFYKSAGTSLVAREFYDDSKRHDTRAVVLGVLGTGAVLYSMHLFFKGEDGLPPPKMDRGIVNVKGVAVDLNGDLMRGQMQVQLKQGF